MEVVDADEEETDVVADVVVDVGGGFLVRRRAGVLVSSMAVQPAYMRHTALMRRLSLSNRSSSGTV